MTAKTQDEPTRGLHTNTARFWQQGFLQQNDLVTLSAETTRHARSVLRLHTGEQVRLFNDTSGEWLAELTGWQANRGQALCLQRLRQAHESAAEQHGPTLYFSPIGAHRIAILLSGAVELGVSMLVPFRSRYTNAHFSHTRATKTMLSAVEQSERLTCPVLQAEQPLSAALLEGEKRLLFCAERGEAESLKEILLQQSDRSNIMRSMAMLVGPEGGFSEAEQNMLRACPCTMPISLGRRVLRCETAALSVLACWQAMRGDWRERRQA